VPAAKDLIDGVVNSAQIPALKRRQDIQRELQSHIEDFVAAAREAGRDPDEIERLVLANFGDPNEIAREFAWVYRHERRRIRALALALSTLLLAGCLSLMVLAAQAALAFGFGSPVMSVLASPHTVIEAFDILAFVVTYLGVTSLENVFETRRFQKAALLLTAILALLTVSSTAVGLHIRLPVLGLVSGISFRAVQLYVAPALARVGIVVILFPLAGLILALVRWPGPPAALAATYASWLVLGLGYELVTHFAARVDAALLNGLQRIQLQLVKGDRA
jgi:hypothetical protein